MSKGDTREPISVMGQTLLRDRHELMSAVGQTLLRDRRELMFAVGQTCLKVIDVISCNSPYSNQVSTVTPFDG